MVTIVAFVGAIFVVIGLALCAFVIQLTDGQGEPRFRGY
jgi:hypothetical protein